MNKIKNMLSQIADVEIKLSELRAKLFVLKKEELLKQITDEKV